MGQPVQPKSYASSYEDKTLPETESPDYSDWEEGSEDLSVDSFTEDGSDYEDVSAQDLLTQLTQQAQAGNLSAEQRQKVLDELRDLDVELQKIGSVDDINEMEAYQSVQERLGAIEADLAEGQGNSGALKAFIEELNEIEIALKADKHIPKEEKEELLAQVEDLRQEAADDPALDPEFFAEDLQAIRDRLKETDAFAKEALRTVGVVDKVITNFKNSPKDRKNLDDIMKRQSGLTKTLPSAEIAHVLYDTSSSAEEQQQKIKDLLKDLPVASQAYVLSIVVNAIAVEDPRKLAFLKDQVPALHEYLAQAIQAGQTSVQTGQAAVSGTTGGFSVGFDGVNYQIRNEDTAWYRDDWNDYSLNAAQLAQPMTSALNILNGGSSAPSA